MRLVMATSLIYWQDPCRVIYDKSNFSHASGFAAGCACKDDFLHLASLSILGLCSPSTQRMASLILLFPLPLGPTMHVTPSWNSMTAGSAKDFEPVHLQSFKVHYFSLLFKVSRAALAAFCSASFLLLPLPSPKTLPSHERCTKSLVVVWSFFPVNLV